MPSHCWPSRATADAQIEHRFSLTFARVLRGLNVRADRLSNAAETSARRRGGRLSPADRRPHGLAGRGEGAGLSSRPPGRSAATRASCAEAQLRACGAAGTLASVVAPPPSRARTGPRPARPSARGSLPLVRAPGPLRPRRRNCRPVRPAGRRRLPGGDPSVPSRRAALGARIAGRRAGSPWGPCARPWPARSRGVGSLNELVPEPLGSAPLRHRPQPEPPASAPSCRHGSSHETARRREHHLTPATGAGDSPGRAIFLLHGPDRTPPRAGRSALSVCAAPSHTRCLMARFRGLGYFPPTPAGDSTAPVPGPALVRPLRTRPAKSTWPDPAVVLARQVRRRRFAGKSADSPRRSVCTRPVAPVPSTTLSSRVVKKTRLFRIFGGLHYSLNLKRFMFVLGMVRTPEGESSLVTSSKLYTFFSFISILKGTERVFVYVLLYKAFIKT